MTGSHARELAAVASLSSRSQVTILSVSALSASAKSKNGGCCRDTEERGISE